MNKIKINIKKTIYLVLFLPFVFLWVTPVSAQPLSGAIFTTDAAGDIVNGNTKYTTKCDVYLDGGPGPNAPATAAGLPDGDYYYQVTDPSGKKLLSRDPAEDRCVTVSGGVITGNCATGIHNTNPSSDAGGGEVVQLCRDISPMDGQADNDDYLDTPNNGGVYKAWITPVDYYAGDPTTDPNQDCGNGCFWGFVPATSKTDNFKVEDKRDPKTFCIQGEKWILEDKKDPIPGISWEIQIIDHLGISTSLITYPNGKTRELCGLEPGFFTVMEVGMPLFRPIGVTVNGIDATGDLTTDPISGDASLVIHITNSSLETTVVHFSNEPCTGGAKEACPVDE